MKLTNKPQVILTTNELHEYTGYTDIGHVSVFLPHFSERMDVDLFIDQCEKGIRRIDDVQRYKAQYIQAIKDIKEEQRINRNE